MENGKDNNFWFEQELQKELADSSVDYTLVESKLFSRVREAERLGELAVLKLDHILPLEKYEELGSKLFSSVAQYKEYEEPINDCIKETQDLQGSRWDVVESKLEQKMHEVSLMPEWEQVLRSSENEFSSGKWEIVEKNLFAKINAVEESDSWNAVLKEEIVQVPSEAESTEEELEHIINRLSKLDYVDQVLLKDQILPQGKWETVEEKLLRRIDNEKLGLDKQLFWHILSNYSSLLKRAAAVVGGLALVVVGLNVYKANYHNDNSIPTLVYQVHGETGYNGVVKVSTGKYSSVKNGRVTLVNDHGSIELTNQTDLALLRITENCAHYKVDFKANKENGGAASFVVKPQTTKRDFRVFTPDYDVVVTGTYFRVEPDVSGKALTRVFEGSVKIESPVFGDTVLKAGQSISYNELSSAYEIRDGGAVVRREELGQIPSVDQLLRQQPLKITSNVRGAEVRINGRVVGYSPLVIRQPVGLYHIALSKRGFSQIDTTVNVSQGDSVQLIEFGLENVKAARVGKNVVVQKTNTDKPVAVQEHHEINELETIAKVNETRYTEETQSQVNTAVGEYRSNSVQMTVPQVTVSNLIEQSSMVQEDNTEEVYLRAQKLEKSGNWKKAIALYEQIFSNQMASKLRREDALFSIGKLKAENEVNVAEAQKVFLSYLANFPNGSYSGESWLRLAELEFPVSPENSIQYYLKYFDKFPWHPRISELQNRVGAIYLQQKKYNEAAIMFRRALNNLDPSKVEEQRYISSNLHQALQKKGDTYQAEQVWNRYLANVPDMP